MKRHGFTLLETMVALVIIALVVTAGLRAGVMTVSATERVEGGTMALWVAQNRIVAGVARLTEGVATGIEQQGGRFFRWRMTTADPIEGFRRIDVAVSDDGEPERTLATLTGYVAVERAP